MKSPRTNKHSRVVKHHAFPLRVGRSRAAFTLLEIIVALSIFVMIIAGVFAIAKGAMELSESLTSTQERSMTRQNFVEFLRNSFRRLPGDSEITLAVQNVRGSYVPVIQVFNGVDAFSPGPPLPPESSVELFAQDTPSGYYRVGLRLLDDKQTNAMRTNASRRPPVGPDDAIIPLIDKVARFEWKFMDATNGRWENTWKGQTRPLFAELTFALDDGVVSRSVFWIPPIVRRPAGSLGVPPGGAPALGPDGQPLPPGTVPPVTVPPPGGSPVPAQ